MPAIEKVRMPDKNPRLPIDCENHRLYPPQPPTRAARRIWIYLLAAVLRRCIVILSVIDNDFGSRARSVASCCVSRSVWG